MPCRWQKPLGPSTKKSRTLSKYGIGDTKTLLGHVTKLYSITGKEVPDGPRSCGGPKANRTFMSMSEELNRKLVETALGSTEAVPGWRRSHDFDCVFKLGVLGRVLGIGACPHMPFWLQSETELDSPTGQIQLFAGGFVIVERNHYAGTTDDLEYVRNCGTFQVAVPEDEMCDGTCVADYPVGACTINVNYEDTFVERPRSYQYTVNGVDVDDGYSFEMDQDYSLTDGLNVHDSAPSCDDMKDIYTIRHNNPGWDWRPSDCHEMLVGAFAGSSHRTGVTQVAAVHIRELRGRIDQQRRRLSLAPFAWTDRAIVARVTAIRSVHLAELRTALTEAYTAAGRGGPEYTDSVILAGVTPIRAVHLAELRSAVVALEIGRSN